MWVVVIPGHILDHLSVGLENVQGVDGGRELVGLGDIPQADPVVVRARQQNSLLQRVPIEAIAFSGMTEQP